MIRKDTDVIPVTPSGKREADGSPGGMHRLVLSNL